MSQGPLHRESPGQLIFPSWKVMILELLEKMSSEQLVDVSAGKALIPVLERLETAGSIISNYQPLRIHELLLSSRAQYIPTNAFGDVLDQMKDVPLGKNEFYTVFDILKSDFTIVDPNISEILGIPAGDFTMQSLLGTGHAPPLIHPHDVKHWIRWGVLGYAMLSLPFFSFSSMENCFLLRFRFSTRNSSIESLKKQLFITLEQRVYPYFEKDERGHVRPTYHFDRWTVFDLPVPDSGRPYCMTESSINPYVNGLFYLLNAYLIDLPLKYVLMLDERQHHDRNKAVANTLNEKIHKGTGLTISFDERQVSDYFVKTIRPRVALALNQWSGRRSNELAEAEGDLQAVRFARELGLIPVPSIVNELAYRLIT